jgi:hypothetical protein
VGFNSIRFAEGCKERWELFQGRWFGVYGVANMWIGAIWDQVGLQVEFC